MNPSNYAPSDVLNAPALLYAGSGQPLTPYFESVASGSSFSIPVSAITWSITAPAGSNATVNGVAYTGVFSINGSGPLYTAITVAATAGTVLVSYTLNNVVYNTPSYY
jgi:hypothetical protein